MQGQTPVEKRADDPADLMRRFLAGRDAPCPQCQYNLRDLDGSRCPECGEELALRVNLVDPKQRLLMAGLVGLSAGAGLNGLLLIYLLVQVLRSHIFLGTGWANPFMIVNGAGFAVEGTALALWLRQWRRIRLLSFSTRVTLMILCWVLTLADVLVFSFTIK